MKKHSLLQDFFSGGLACLLATLGFYSQVTTRVLPLWAMSLCNKFYTSTAPTFAFSLSFSNFAFPFHFRFQLLLHILTYMLWFLPWFNLNLFLLLLLTMGLCNKFYTWTAFCVALSLSKFTFSFSSLSLTLCELSVCGATSFTPRPLLPVLFHHRFLFQILPLILRRVRQHFHYYTVYPGSVQRALHLNDICLFTSTFVSYFYSCLFIQLTTLC